MSRLENTFKRKKSFIGYFTGGDGGVEYSVACAQALIEGGVDILEIGFPFSDPVADGPVIQKAHQRALDNGANAEMVLEITRKIRQSAKDIPLVLFSYFNPLLQKGENFLKEAKSAGFDALLSVDKSASCDPQDPNTFFESVKNAGLDPIILTTPSTTEERLKQVLPIAQGFLYYVSHKGTTGVRKQLADDFSRQMERLKQYCSIPIAAGFGIADRQSAQKALDCADGFVVGSAFVKLMEEKADPDRLKRLAQEIDPRS